MNDRIKPYLRIFSLAVLTATLCLAMSQESSAQIGTASAALNGTVRDASGAVVPDATITLKNTQTGFRTSDEEQRHRKLFSGEYQPGQL